MTKSARPDIQDFATSIESRVERALRESKNPGGKTFNGAKLLSIMSDVPEDEIMRTWEEIKSISPEERRHRRQTSLQPKD